MTFSVREFTTRAEFEALYPFIAQLNKDMTREIFEQRLEPMLARGYRCAGVFDDTTGECLGICGFWIGWRFYCGKYVDLDNFVVSEAHRSRGVGKILFRWIEALAERESCAVSVLDSYVTNPASHKFYFREGYQILGYHFVKRFS